MFLINREREAKSLTLRAGSAPSQRCGLGHDSLPDVDPADALRFVHEWSLRSRHVSRHRVPRAFCSAPLPRASRERRIFAGGRQRFGIRGLADWASLPVLLLFLAVLGELALPVVNGYSRGNGHAADVYGLEVIHAIVPEANRAAAEAFQILGEINLADDPSPFIRFWLDSHPPLPALFASRDVRPCRRGIRCVNP